MTEQAPTDGEMRGSAQLIAATYAVMATPQYLAVAADVFVMAAALHDAGRITRLEYLRARLHFHQAMAFHRGEPVPGLALNPSPCVVVNLKQYRSKRHGN